MAKDNTLQPVPTQTDDASGVKYDYCDGARVIVPHGNLYEVRFHDRLYHTNEVFVPQRDNE